MSSDSQEEACPWPTSGLTASQNVMTCDVGVLVSGVSGGEVEWQEATSVQYGEKNKGEGRWQVYITLSGCPDSRWLRFIAELFKKVLSHRTLCPKGRGDASTYDPRPQLMPLLALARQFHEDSKGSSGTHHWRISAKDCDISRYWVTAAAT